MLLTPHPQEGIASAICVDLDGTLVRGDLFAESIVAAIRRHPVILFLLPIWFLRGLAFVKAKIASYSDLDASLLPYNHALIEYLKVRKRAGDDIYLATAAHAVHANKVADYLGLFTAVLATSNNHNLKGARKLQAIEQMLGDRPFLYAANSRDDLVVWRQSAGAIAVDVPRSVTGSLEEERIPVLARFSTPGRFWKACLRALRVHQWAKNILVFVPLLLSHQITDLSKIIASLLAFFSFSACASAFYVLNDLSDLAADRAHPRKRFRPFASGELSVAQGLILLAVTSILSVLLAWPLPITAKVLLGLYAVLNLAYLTRLKELMFLDVLVLAFLYTLRVLFGGASADITVSVWTLAFSIFLFLGLALVKRLTELVRVAGQREGLVPRRGYMAADLSAVRSFASSSLYVSVVVMALYINSPDVLRMYSRPEALWLVCLILIYWVSRLLMLASRGSLLEDPILFALTDRVSQGIAALVIACAILALPMIP